MKPSKLMILYHFLLFRISRKYSSNRVPSSRLRKWRKNILNSPFYRDVLDSEDAFPIMTKAKFMKEFDDINTVNIKKEEAFYVAYAAEKSRDFSPTIRNISVGLSSGTSGSRGIFLTSKEEKEKWVAAILDRVLGFSLRRRTVAFFLRANNNLYEAVNSKLLTFNFYNIKTDIQLHTDALEKNPPHILVGQPSVLSEIAKSPQIQRITSHLKKVISVAEVLELDIQKQLEDKFNCKISQVYQCTEGFLAYTCHKGSLHFNEDFLKIERDYIDDDRQRFHPIITDYLRSSQPIVRYRLNDIIHEGLPCQCGSTSLVIKKIEGRMDDVFKFKQKGGNILIFPDFIRRAVISVSEDIINYQVTRVAEYEIMLAVEAKDNHQDIYERTEQALQELFKTHNVHNINIVKTEIENDPMRKFSRIKNDHHEEI